MLERLSFLNPLGFFSRHKTMTVSRHLAVFGGELVGGSIGEKVGGLIGSSLGGDNGKMIGETLGLIVGSNVTGDAVAKTGFLISEMQTGKEIINWQEKVAVSNNDNSVRMK